MYFIRPAWDENTTATELDAKEKQNFLEWRRRLAMLQETKGLLMTPYEKNLEFWRQLWRVVERRFVLVSNIYLNLRMKIQDIAELSFFWLYLMIN